MRRYDFYKPHTSAHTKIEAASTHRSLSCMSCDNIFVCAASVSVSAAAIALSGPDASSPFCSCCHWGLIWFFVLLHPAPAYFERRVLHWWSPLGQLSGQNLFFQPVLSWEQVVEQATLMTRTSSNQHQLPWRPRPLVIYMICISNIW